MQSHLTEKKDVKFLLNAIATLNKDLDVIREHLADFKTLIEACSGSVSIVWPNEEWKLRNGTVGASGCNHPPTQR